MTLFIYDVLYAVPLSLVLTYLSAEVLQLYEVSLAVYALAAAFTVYFAGFLRSGRWVRAALILLLFLGVLLPVRFIPEEGETAAFLYRNRWVLWCFLTALAAFVLERVLARFLYAKCALAALIAIGLAVTAALGRTVPGPAVAVALFFVLCTAAEAVRETARKKKPLPEGQEDRPVHAYMAYLAPFLLLVLLYTALYKAPEEPYGWEFAKRIYANVSSAVDRLQIGVFQRRSESYEDAEVGFSERSLFPGSLSDNGREVMYVTGDTYYPAQVYLVGKVFTRFEGRTWASDADSSDNEQLLDYMETFAAVRRFDPEKTYDYIRSASVLLEYRFFSSAHLFHPQKTLITGNVLTGIGFRHEGANIVAEKRISYEDAYRLTYLRLNRGNAAFEDLLTAETLPTKAEWDEAVEASRVHQSAHLSYENYLAYRAEQLLTYGEPPVLTERTAQWLKKAVGEEQSAYGKALRIAAALKKMDYDVSPGQLPASVQSGGDFLDWFLFEGKCGYCNHYATALTLLSRAAGVPARYVQGFVASARTETTLLWSGQAHSWCEILVPGFGWLTMDATPGYGVDSSWPASGGSAKPGNLLPDDDDGEDDEHDEPDPAVIEELRRQEEERQQAEARRKAAILRTLLILAGSAVLAVLAVLGFRLLTVRKRYDRAEAGVKLRILAARNMRLLSGLGLENVPGETLAEYAQRISAFEPFDGESPEGAEETLEKIRRDYPAFTESYERFLFKDLQPQAEEIAAAEGLSAAIRELVRTVRPFAGRMEIFAQDLKE
ncbi:MAG: transglutaminase domain-containing protein [Lachnospiraceae bacterium]|nr:transglutaminase domain-containing protein [Lachnospiraceae bacterium]